VPERASAADRHCLVDSVDLLELEEPSTGPIDEFDALTDPDTGMKTCAEY